MGNNGFKHCYTLEHLSSWWQQTRKPLFIFLNCAADVNMHTRIETGFGDTRCHVRHSQCLCQNALPCSADPVYAWYARGPWQLWMCEQCLCHGLGRLKATCGWGWDREPCYCRSHWDHMAMVTPLYHMPSMARLLWDLNVSLLIQLTVIHERKETQDTGKAMTGRCYRTQAILGLYLYRH